MKKKKKKEENNNNGIFIAYETIENEAFVVENADKEYTLWLYITFLFLSLSLFHSPSLYMS